MQPGNGRQLPGWLEEVLAVRAAVGCPILAAAGVAAAATLFHSWTGSRQTTVARHALARTAVRSTVAKGRLLLRQTQHWVQRGAPVL